MNVKQIWQAALMDLQAQTPRASFETWVRPLSAVSFDDDMFVLRAPSTFARDWLESRLLADVRESLARIVGRPIQVRVVAGAESWGPEAKEDEGEGREREAGDQQEVNGRGARVRGRRRGSRGAEAAAGGGEPKAETGDAETPRDLPAPGPQPLVPRYTFATFVVGPSNQLAHAAALSVAERPGQGYNPLFIYGGVGLGKTHLLHAIAHLTQAAGYRTLYVTSEAFTNDLIAAIRGSGRTEDFRRHYRDNDVLLVDDVQFIAGKEATQEEFFHTFNELHGAGRQVVLSSDRPPRAIPTLEDRLRSRFEWGLIADIQPPDLETRTAILQKKAAEQSVAFPPEVITFLAQRIQSNIRELEGSLNRVVAYARTTGRPLNPDTAAAALSDLMANPIRRFIGPPQVVEAVCRFYRVEPRSLRGRARDREVVVPRQVAMYLMREETEASLLEIGRELGGRDHSTVLHGINKVQAEIEADAQLRKDVLAIRELLYASARP